MSSTARYLIEQVQKEVGYKEQAGNKNKYAEYIDANYPNFYNGKKNGFDWCDIFVDYMFLICFGEKEAKRLLCQPEKSLGAGCTFSKRYYEGMHQFDKTPEPGAQIFFSNDHGKTAFHTGIVVGVSDSYVYTIEGNADNEVKRRTYKRDYVKICGYGHPKYDEENPEKAVLKVDVDLSKYSGMELHFTGY